LKTSEPQAAEWISKAIGEVEIERCRETRTHGQFPQNRNSESQQREITREPLVMASEIGGLDPLHGFLKHGNYVVRLRVPYLQLEAHHEKFIKRRPKEDGTLSQVKYVPPSIEPPRDAPGAQMEIKPLSQNQGQQHFYE
jgi:type IV secretory pathway TraG/TraD family ATPase VirD4